MSSSSTPTQNDLAKKLKELHVSGKPLIVANVWDAPSAQTISEQASTKAIATASYAVAAVQGIEDHALTLVENLAGIRYVAAGIKKAGKADEIPLSADLQDGYDDPAETIRKAIALGVVGANIEDLDNKKETLRSVDEAVMRIQAAHKAATHAGVPDFVINARTDVLGFDGTIQDAIDRGKKFIEAGATTAFIWGAFKHDITPEEVEEMVKALDGKLAVQPGNIEIEKLVELGVARISVGPRLWMDCMATLVGNAKERKLL